MLEFGLIHFAASLGGYLLGSVPFGLVLTRLFGLGDIRAIGSGNIGATNVLRTGRKDLAAATLILDSGKGAAAALLATLATADYRAGLAAGAFAVIGHNFPVWLRFHGGKGVATTLGVLLATAWPVGVLACLTWAAMAALFRFSSLAALTALGLAPLYAVFLAGTGHVVVFAMLAVIGVIRHRANIRRLMTGDEPRIRLGGR